MWFNYTKNIICIHGCFAEFVAGFSAYDSTVSDNVAIISLAEISSLQDQNTNTVSVNTTNIK